jgi:hypothetical protein
LGGVNTVNIEKLVLRDAEQRHRFTATYRKKGTVILSALCLRSLYVKDRFKQPEHKET